MRRHILDQHTRSGGCGGKDCGVIDLRSKAARGIIVAAVLLFLPVSVWAFGCDYHEFLAYYWWTSDGSRGEPTMEDGGVFFVLASSAADIRRHTAGVRSVVVMDKYPEQWLKTKWRYFHTRKGSKELVEALFGPEVDETNFGRLLRKITADDLVKKVLPGEKMAQVCVDERQKWIARGWAFHCVCDYIGAAFEMVETGGTGTKFHPDAVTLRRVRDHESRKQLDMLNDARSAFWMTLDDAAPRFRQQLKALLSRPESGGEILGNFAFVAQRAYDSCGADDLGMGSTMERAQKVMLPIFNDCAAGVSVALPGLKQRLGWAAPQGYAERERYAREVVIPALFKKANSMHKRGKE